MLKKLKNIVSNENYISNKQEKDYELLQGIMVAISLNIITLSVLEYSSIIIQFMKMHPPNYDNINKIKKEIHRFKRNAIPIAIPPPINPTHKGNMTNVWGVIINPHGHIINLLSSKCIYKFILSIPNIIKLYQCTHT